MLLARFTDSRLLAAYFLVLFLVWTGARPGICLADDSAEDVDAEPEAVVDAGDVLVEESAPSPALLFDDPSASIERIDVEAVRERYRDLGALLEDLAGLRVMSFGGPGRSASVSLRGSTGKQVLVLLDGVPLNGAGEAFDLSSIPLDQLVGVEVIRGSVSALYGGGAVGGAINLIPRRTETSGSGAGGSWRLQGGTQTTTGATLTGWRPDPQTPILFQLLSQHTRGDFRFTDDNGTSFNPNDDRLVRRENNEAHTTSLLARQAWHGANSSLTATLSGFWRYRGEPGIATFPSPSSHQKEDRYLVDLTWRSSDWLATDSETEIKLFGRYGRSLYQDPNGEQTGTPISSQQEQRLAGVRVGTVLGHDPDWIWTVLLEANQESLNDRSPQLLEGGGNQDRTAFAAGVRGEWLFDPQWTLVGAVRGDTFSDQPSRISPKLGLVFAHDERWTLRASAGNGYRPPSFSELADSRGFVVGNPDLRPEVSRSLEVAAEYADESSRFTASLFRTDTRDLIEYVQLSGFRFKPLNFGRVRAEGLELAGNGSLLEDLGLSGAWTLQSVTDETGGANRTGQTIPGRPASYGHLSIDWTPGDFESVLSWHYIGRNSVTLSNTKQLASRERVDWSLVWRAGPDTVSLQLENLLDTDAVDLRGFPLPGRTWLLAYTHSW